MGGYIPYTLLTPSQHVRAQKIPGFKLVVCDSVLIGLQASPVVPSAAQRSARLTETQRQTHAPGSPPVVHATRSVRAAAAAAAVVLLLQRLERQIRLVVRVDFDPAILIRSLSRSLASFIASL